MRPMKNSKPKRDMVIRAKVTTEEYKRLEREAQQQMRTLSQWVRLKLGVQP